MAKVLVTAEVEDLTKWEEGFRTHRELFKSQTISQPINFTTTAGNQVAICLEPDDLQTFMDIMDSPATAEAMAFDGVKRETVKLLVLDKELVV